ncbi:phosphoserine phosphatase SerB [Micrococcales bacterium 31B]|nr:phosphoserine phosphatase SerB [Micrococcales bacterium 31B]
MDLSDQRTVLVRIKGEDSPGVSSQIFEALSAPDVVVLDVEQLVVRGELLLNVLVTAGANEGAMMARVTEVGRNLGFKVSCRAGLGDNRPKPRNRLAVSILGNPVRPIAVSEVAGAISAAGANIDRVRRVSRWPVTTFELEVSGGDSDQLRREVAIKAAQYRVDIAVSPLGLARRGRRLLVMDVDSTLITGEVIEMLAAHAGVEAQVRDVTERAMRGELDFAESLHERVATLKGLPVSVLDEVRETIVLTPGARTVCRTLRSLGYSIALVSGGFQEIIEPIAADLGVHRVRANQLEVVDGHLTGRVRGPVIDRAAKATALREFAAAEDLPLSRTIAIGDGANDLDMLSAAGLGVAFNAKPMVRRQAKASVNVPFLDSVLYMLGISREEIEELEREHLDVEHERESALASTTRSAEPDREVVRSANI